MTSPPPSHDSAGVVAPPPLIFLAFLLAGVGADWLRPLPFLTGMARYALAALLIATAGALALWAVARFLRADTNVAPHRPATALVAAGPYRFTRNPMYLGLILLLLGIAAAVDTLWLVLFAVPFALVLRYGVIAREERYLEGKFGDSYRAYRARVRRWI